MVYDEKSVIIWTTFLLKTQCCFSLVSFKVFKYFFLVFNSFIMMCLGIISLTLYWLPFTEFLRSVNWLFHQIWEILAIVSSNVLMYQYLFFWDSKDMNAKHYDIVPQISVAMLIIFQSVVPLSFRLDNSYSHLFSSSLTLISIVSMLLLSPSSKSFISDYIFFSFKISF